MAGQTVTQAPLPALCTSSDGHLSMYQVSFNSLLYFQRYAQDKLFIAKIKMGSNSANTGDRVMVLVFCNFMALCQCIKFHFFIFNSFRGMLQTSLHLQKIRMGNNSVITCDRVTVLALCTSSDGRLLMYQVSFNSRPYFQRYALDKLFTVKIKKGSNSVNTLIGLWFLHSAIPLMALYQCIKFH